ncbi:MAG: alpha/beta fold hydrolase [Gammaproteobacteria bacterium]|nr:alpha/beta fold hydrolase [Gammaproteobacteria bacterium]
MSARGLAMALAALACALPAAMTSAADAMHRVRIEGAGAATVVFEAGLGDTLDVWKRVQDAVPQGCARTFAYNRAGYPGSERSSGVRDAESVVAELRAELAARGLAPPYVRVGHSLGGLYMRYYARQHPGEVQGLLLVDSTHWDQLGRIRAQAPAMYGTVRAVSLLMMGPMRREFADSTLAGEQVQASPAPAGTPTIVLSSSRAAPGETPAFRVLMRRLQDEIAAEYAARRHSFPVASGHYIQRDRPRDVVDAVRELAGCSDRGA